MMEHGIERVDLFAQSESNGSDQLVNLSLVHQAGQPKSSIPSHKPRYLNNPAPTLTQTISSFWVCGLALLVCHLAARFLHLQGKSHDWAQYMLLGTAFPI